MSQNGSSFFQPPDGAKVTVIKLTQADKSYAHNASLMNLGVMMGEAIRCEADIPDTFSASRDRNLRAAETRYRNRQISVLAALSELTGISKEELQPKLQRAAARGERVGINKRYSVEFFSTRAALITYPDK